MICDKCGKCNPGQEKKCIYCGADMPESFICTGFADILSMPAKQESNAGTAGNIGRTQMINNVTNPGGVDETTMKHLLNNSEITLKEAKKSSTFAMLAVILCGITLVFTLIFGVVILSGVKNAANNVQTPVEPPVVQNQDDGNKVEDEGKDVEAPAPEQSEQQEETEPEAVSAPTMKELVSAVEEKTVAFNAAQAAYKEAEKAKDTAQEALDKAKSDFEAAIAELKTAAEALDAVVAAKQAEADAIAAEDAASEAAPEIAAEALKAVEEANKLLNPTEDVQPENTSADTPDSNPVSEADENGGDVENTGDASNEQ